MTKRIVYAKMKDYFEYNEDTLSSEVLELISSNDLWTGKRYASTIDRLLKKVIPELTNREVVIYGAGQFGELLYDAFTLRGIKVKAFIDVYKASMKEYKNIPIISIADFLNEFQGIKLVVSNITLATSGAITLEITDAFQKAKVNMKDVYFAKDFYLDYQHNEKGYLLSKKTGLPRYFAPAELVHRKDEIYVDIGTYNGVSIKDFLQWCKMGGGYKKIYSFEIVPEYREKLKQMFRDNRNIEICDYGVANEENIINLNYRHSASRIEYSSAANAEPVSITTIDSFFKDIAVTFIKINTVGLELEVLQGAEKTIKKCCPQLCVNLFLNDDLWWRVPELLWSYTTNYKIMLRQYGEQLSYLVAIPL